MIDDPEKSKILIAKLKEALPIAAGIPQHLQRDLAAGSPEIQIPVQCKVVDILDLGDEGGLVCCLDIGGPDTTEAHLVSITHLTFDRRCFDRSTLTSATGSRNSSGNRVGASDASPTSQVTVGGAPLQ